MVAHLDAVTSLAVDPNGLYLLSGSKDSSDIFCVSIPQSRTNRHLSASSDEPS